MYTVWPDTVLAKEVRLFTQTTHKPLSLPTHFIAASLDTGHACGFGLWSGWTVSADPQHHHISACHGFKNVHVCSRSWDCAAFVLSFPLWSICTLYLETASLNWEICMQHTQQDQTPIFGLKEAIGNCCKAGTPYCWFWGFMCSSQLTKFLQSLSLHL